MSFACYEKEYCMYRFFKTPFTLSTVAAIALVTLIIGVLVARVFNPTTTRANANAPASGMRVDVIVKATDSQFWQAMLAGELPFARVVLGRKRRATRTPMMRATR